MVRLVVLHAVITSGRIYVWRTSEETSKETSKETYKPECLVGRSSVMVWVAMSWYSILLVLLLPFAAELLQGSMWAG
jgi:hypothetical protein